MISDIADIIDPDGKWEKLQSVGMVESIRTVDGKTSSEIRYYISSLMNDAKNFGTAVRSHWGIENPLHWVLDVGFYEDACRIRKCSSKFCGFTTYCNEFNESRKISKIGHAK